LLPSIYAAAVAAAAAVHAAPLPPLVLLGQASPGQCGAHTNAVRWCGFMVQMVNLQAASAHLLCQAPCLLWSQDHILCHTVK
jgi:hypothetical protein